jgi:glycosyltransferase involved in cell wall biosynthesis
MHVVIVHQDLHQTTRGGICTLYRQLAHRLHALGAQVTLVTRHTPCPPTIDGVAVKLLPRTTDPAAHREAVANLLTDLAPDVVECSTWDAEALHYLRLPRSRRAPVVVRGEFSAATLGAHSMIEPERGLLHRAERVIAVSHYAAQDLAAAYGISLPQVVPNGVDPARFCPGPAADPTSGYQISLDEDGHPSDPRPIPTLRNAARVPPWDRDPHGRLRLVWIGKITPMKGWDLLEQIIHRLRDLAVITVLLGHSDAYCPISIDPTTQTILHDLDDTDLPGFLRAADWLLSTSRWEGFGLAIAEALACGTPVLLPEHLGTAPELLAAGGGYTFRDPDHLAAILTGRPRPPARLPSAFDWDRNAETSLDIYHQLQ